MPIQLPPPIDAYVRLENSGDAAGLAEVFAADAVVRDEGQTHQGLAAIAEWRAATKRKYRHSLEPLDVARRRGKTVLRAGVHGEFPGSPVTLDFSFVIRDEKVVSLEIGA